MNGFTGYTGLDANNQVDDRPDEVRVSGWIIGITIGVFVTLFALPPVRYTLLAQLQFAIAERSYPLLHSMTVRPSRHDIALFDSVASATPDEYLLQVGRATAMAGQGGLRAIDTGRTTTTS